MVMLEKLCLCLDIYLQAPLRCARYVSIRHRYLENHQGGSLMLSWSLPLADSLKLISLLKEGLDQYIEVYFQMVRWLQVKQHKLASSQGDQEFCSEVEVLNCAQHRNVVMLIGFCIEDGRRLLVYEYICNGSLDSHLYGYHRDTLDWEARQKIAVGAARGLRYLHEECRVGCIVHRDMRPNNILITHDFEPLVGDFGLARWQPDGDTGEETRVIGTFGFVFNVILFLLARPLLEENAIDELIDSRLGSSYSEEEVYCMLQTASLCINLDPQIRPRMSQVLRILERDMMMDSSSDVGNRSGRIYMDHQQSPIRDRFGGTLSLNSTRPYL
ncbi:hypothetical protein R6Q59_013007 [Mikania micrantha]